MSTLLGHIAGIPVEETALALGPALVAVGGVLTARLRLGLRNRRRPARSR